MTNAVSKFIRGFVNPGFAPLTALSLMLQRNAR
jgi:hypothetical protein